MYSVIILSAGFSTRMKGPHKGLLPIYNVSEKKHCTILEYIIKLYSGFGVDDIIVVSGVKEYEALSNEINILSKKYNIRHVHNADAELGMFSSICKGFDALPKNSLGCFIQPVDIPLIRQCSLYFLQQAIVKFPQTVLIPTYQSEDGHPPYIPIDYIKHILANDDEGGGLRSILAQLPCERICVPDSFILQDMDTPEQYAQIKKLAVEREFLNVEEALELLYCLDVSPLGIAHAKSVSRVAGAFADELLKYCSINPELARVGALLHDMCKTQPQHEKAAGAMLRKLGLSALAPLVEEHNDCFLPADADIAEKELIYLADKYVSGFEFIPLRQRFEQKLAIYADNLEVANIIKGRLGRAINMEKRLNNIIGISAEKLAIIALS